MRRRGGIGRRNENAEFKGGGGKWGMACCPDLGVVLGCEGKSGAEGRVADVETGGIGGIVEMSGEGMLSADVTNKVAEGGENSVVLVIRGGCEPGRENWGCGEGLLYIVSSSGKNVWAPVPWNHI